MCMCENNAAVFCRGEKSDKLTQKLAVVSLHLYTYIKCSTLKNDLPKQVNEYHFDLVDYYSPAPNLKPVGALMHWLWLLVMTHLLATTCASCGTGQNKSHGPCRESTNYSETSLSGLSIIRTQYKKTPYKGHVLRNHELSNLWKPLY